MNKILIYTLLASLTSTVYADTNNMTELIEELKQEKIENDIKIRKYLDKNNNTKQRVFSSDSDKSKKVIQRMESDVPVYYKTFNESAAQSTNTRPLNASPFSVRGEGYDKMGIWDGGAVRSTHTELSGRIIQKDNPSSLSNHATHVSGTLIGSGQRTETKGMASQATLLAYDFNNDTREMAEAASEGMEVSNHSYGRVVGWEGSSSWFGDTRISSRESHSFGYYNSSTRLYDRIANNAPNYLIVFAAGNDRSNRAPAAGTEHTHNGNSNQTFTDTHNDDGFDDGGYDTLSPNAVAKNILSIGAVNDVENYRNPSDVRMSSFSGWGPTDDGRIKPDLVGNGVRLLSASSSNDNAYATLSGTSMASPNVTGSLALLQQYYQKTHGDTAMTSASLKALAIHTAKETGTSIGPDYQFGWGILDATKAGQKIEEDINTNVIDEISLANGETYTREIVIPSGLASFKVTIVWNDPAGTVTPPALDSPIKKLVNDLDLKLSNNGTTHYPWRLDKDNPSRAARKNAKNSVDNVEQVYIENPNAGSYTITVNHAAVLESRQDFSIVIDTIAENTETPVTPVDPEPVEPQPVEPQPATGISPINFGQTVNGSWNANADVFRNRFPSFYSFTLDEETAVRINLRSEEDTYLILLEGENREGNVVVFDDDGGKGNNSRLNRTLPAGTYTIEATTFQSQKTGDFRINVQLLAP